MFGLVKVVVEPEPIPGTLETIHAFILPRWGICPSQGIIYTYCTFTPRGNLESPIHVLARLWEVEAKQKTLMKPTYTRGVYDSNPG